MVKKFRLDHFDNSFYYNNEIRVALKDIYLTNQGRQIKAKILIESPNSTKTHVVYISRKSSKSNNVFVDSILFSVREISYQIPYVTIFAFENK